MSVERNNSKYGDIKTKDDPLYKRWANILSRCHGGSDRKYYRYGGRGIVMCDHWKNNFLAFREWALANGFEENLQIDRIDNDGPYSPENCRFVTHLQNQQNKAKYGSSCTCKQKPHIPPCPLYKWWDTDFDAITKLSDA